MADKGCTYATSNDPMVVNPERCGAPVHGVARLNISGEIVSSLCEKHFLMVMQRITRDRREDQYTVEVL